MSEPDYNLAQRGPQRSRSAPVDPTWARPLGAHLVTLSPGTRVGVYEITAAIGAGGMGQVYRARDTKLDRDVALKILPELFAGDPDRLMRFEREAKTLASLNHPHIAQIHGFEQQGPTSARTPRCRSGRPTRASWGSSQA